MTIRVLKTGSIFPGKDGNEATATAYKKVNENFSDLQFDVDEVEQRVTDIEDNIVDEIDGGTY